MKTTSDFQKCNLTLFFFGELHIQSSITFISKLLLHFSPYSFNPYRFLRVSFNPYRDLMDWTMLT